MHTQPAHPARVGRVPAVACRLVPLVAAAFTLAACVPRPVVPPGMVVVGARPLPTMLQGDRIFVTPITESGDTLILSVETGNGTSMLYAAAVDRLDLALVPLVIGTDTAWLVDLPPLQPSTDIPPLVDMPDIGTRFFVFPADAEGEDGFLGQSWLAGRTWIFDYPDGRIWLVPPGVLPAHSGDQRVMLGFRQDAQGQRMLNVPRIRVRIGDDSLDLVLDTGASAAFTERALDSLDAGGQLRAASFVSASVVERWRREHPGWSVVEQADSRTGLPMIRVPAVEVAGQSTGPVWFVAAPEERFTSHVSQLTDSPVMGALGGNALREFAITVDYEHAIAIFRRTADHGGHPE